MARFEVTFHRGHKNLGHVEKKVEIVEAEDSEQAMEIALESAEGTSWRIDKVEEVR